MRCHIQCGVANLPVTALHTLKHGDFILLFSNEGSRLVVRCGNDKRVVLSHQIFDSQTIHGIVSSRFEENDTITRYRLVIWGGRSLCRCILSVEHVDRCQTLDLQLEASDLELSNDWIMTIVTDERQPYAIVLTAHNILWRLNLDLTRSHSLFLIARGLETLLYSAAVQILDDECLLVASGTLFGEVILWTCSQLSPALSWVPKTRHIFLGHSGSVFGVAISQELSYNNRRHRLLASCSDDRTVRIWDISDCEREGCDMENVNRTVSDTGFGKNDNQKLQIAMAWGHISRIWAVAFGSVSPSSHQSLPIVSRGEDGVCQFWQLNLDMALGQAGKAKTALEAVAHDRHHAGKNAWSMDICSKVPQPVVYTGGADGQIISRHFPQRGTCEGSVKINDFLSDLEHCRGRGLKKYLAIDDDTVVAATDTGDLIRIRTSDPQRGKLLFTATVKSNITLCSNHLGGMVFFCLPNGTLYAYDNSSDALPSLVCSLPTAISWMQVVYCKSKEGNTSLFYLIAKTYERAQPTLIKISKKEGQFAVVLQQVQIPADVVVTSSLYCAQQDMLVCGSRSGALAVCTDVSATSTFLDVSLIVRHVHGSDSVASITSLTDHFGSFSLDASHILTTGRDGTFAVHQLKHDDHNTNIRTLHRASHPFGTNVEGAYFLASGVQGQALVLYGFRSTSFVVWDETHQTQLSSIECGGSHRSWSYSPRAHGADLFVWTKAGAFNFYSNSRSTHDIIQPGGHGREIKATAVSISSHLLSANDTGNSRPTLLATGAEDTDVRLFKYTRTSLSQISVLKHHTTGLQDLKFSKCGRYLFSGGGVEEFIVWKLSRVPLIGVGAVIVAKLEKTDEDTDARIMSFDVVDDAEDDTSNDTCIYRSTILMAYSNGKAKVVEFFHDESSGAGNLRLVQQLHVGTLCLTQAAVLTDDSWQSVLIGATDGYLRLSDMNPSKESVAQKQVQQSNIAAMSTYKLDFGAFLIATGGDDNALAFTLLLTGSDGTDFRSITVPRAHAAALTAIAFVKPRGLVLGEKIYAVTAGNDQRLKLWYVGSLAELVTAKTYQNTRVDPMPGVEVMQVCEYATNVADVSSLEIVDDGQGLNDCFEFDVIVAGVGVQSVHFDIHE